MSDSASFVFQCVQIVGSLFVLIAFVTSLLGRMRPSSYTYLIVNAVGSGILAGTAIVGLEWGFILLEGVWSLMSIVSIIRKMRGAELQSEQE